MGKWSEPVILDAANRGVDGTFTRTSDALVTLQTSWPRKCGEVYERALHACEAAAAGKINHDHARGAFLDAADEIGIFARI